jgi:hypothetical protein
MQQRLGTTPLLNPEHIELFTYPKVSLPFYLFTFLSPLRLTKDEQITPEKFGKSECFLVRRLHFSSKETWNSFTPLNARDEDIELRKRLADDGLVVDEWVTIPDPCEVEWPFARRHPGK